MHPESDVLLAFVDDELNDAQRTEVAAHMAQCDACGARAAEFRQATSLAGTLLAAIDAAEPERWRSAPTMPAIAEQTATAESPVAAQVIDLDTARADRVRGGGARSFAAWRWAAAAVLVTSAGVAGVVLSRTTSSTPVTESVGAAATNAAAVPRSGVSVAALDGAVNVVLEGAGPGSRLAVIVDPAAVSVSLTVEGVESPQYEAEEGRIAVDLLGARGTVLVRVPAGVSAAVRAAGRELAAVRAGSVVPVAAGAAAGIAIPPQRP